MVLFWQYIVNKSSFFFIVELTMVTWNKEKEHIANKLKTMSTTISVFFYEEVIS